MRVKSFLPEKLLIKWETNVHVPKKGPSPLDGLLERKHFLPMGEKLSLKNSLLTEEIKVMSSQSNNHRKKLW